MLTISLRINGRAFGQDPNELIQVLYEIVDRLEWGETNFEVMDSDCEPVGVVKLRGLTIPKPPGDRRTLRHPKPGDIEEVVP